MIPSLLDRQIRQGVADFVRTTFSVTTPSMRNMVDDLCDTPDRLFKGPWISMGLPFLAGRRTASEHFPNLSIPFPPHRHQEVAWDRLKEFRSTLVATGTGSGKTECFLYPVLEHIRKQKALGRKGIQAILIYPMNALASDQARRIAKAVASDPNLKKVRAGLWVGEKSKTPHQEMMPESVITDKKTMLLEPPDILLTNYKMLDYLLTRPEDRSLWDDNVPGSEGNPSNLRYLVVDELHTFDGAQGTDLGLLVRRLKERLGCRPGDLCCVGTSATLGGPESDGPMREYAARIFGEDFDAAALVTEQRQTATEFLGTRMDLMGSRIPQWQERDTLDPDQYETPEGYLRAQAPLWLPGWEVPTTNPLVALGEKLKRHAVFRALVEILANSVLTQEQLLLELGNRFGEFDLLSLRREVVGAGGDLPLRRFRENLLASLVSLAAWARSGSEAERLFPLLQSVRVQSWIREMRRMVATVAKEPRLEFSDDLARATREGDAKTLPVVYCRECGNTGWVGMVQNQNSDHLRSDAGSLTEFYRTFFLAKPSEHLRFLFPDLGGKAVLRSGQGADSRRVCTGCLKIFGPDFPGPCNCGCQSFVDVLIPDSRVQDSSSHWYTLKECPGCGSRQSLVVVGAQSASLSSALINQLFASRFNPDKKLIAFSDNVQDASHRASFFGARTWKFNLRGAIQQMLDSTEGPIDLTGLGRKVVEYWQDQWRDDVRVASLFAPPDVLWMEELRKLQAGEKADMSSMFWNGLKERIDWEVLTEYGLDCRKGRTLEKSGASVAQLNLDWSGEWLANLASRIAQDIPLLRGQELPDRLRSFLGGMVRRWIHNGAIGHGALDKYIEELGNPFVIHRNSHWMRQFGKSARTPSFPWKAIKGEDSRGRLDPIDSRSDKPTSWYAHWMIKHWGNQDIQILHQYEILLNHCLTALENESVLERRKVVKNGRETNLWMLAPERMRVAKGGVLLGCNECGHQITLPAPEAADFNPLLCFRNSCSGTYQEQSGHGRYYRNLYTHGDLVRLMPQEHTSLLNREERETVEGRFKSPIRNSWDPNLLSCTPTLEMGIDIGDLSSVLLCSMPPKQASFLQRIGRAGRTDGNAVVQTVAEGAAHDLYFWADPDEMLKGKVEPPGVFLDATAVLERQLIAFGLDCWVAEDESVRLPRSLRNMLDGWKLQTSGAFPLSFLSFVDTNHERLLDRFLRFLGAEASADTKAYLREFLDPTRVEKSMRWKFKESLDLAVKSRQALMMRLKHLNQEHAARTSDPQINTDLVQELEMERNALERLIQKQEGKDCYQFMTEEGMIPNYAFPESGVQLKSVIYQRRPSAPNATTASPRNFKETFEYERAAAAAISDFAPGNWFYAHGRRVRIDQVELSVTSTETCRLCPQCGHIQFASTGTVEHGGCPMCQCAEFAAVQQVQTLLRIRQMYATTSDRKSRVGDDSDTRDVGFFEKSMQVGLQDSHILGAWELDDKIFPFGYEVRSHVKLREINFGALGQGAVAAGGLKVGGKEVRSRGFTICKYCGKVEIEGQIDHTFQCKQKHPKSDQDVLSSAFLFREFEGEAMRLFLPTLSEGATEDLRSFLAAFHLGLKLHYKGDVGHLQATLQTEPIPGYDSARKPFVVVYDAVPGGTGYLKQFVQDPGFLKKVLGKARDRLRDCSCQHDPNKDGCYRCLLAHRNSREMQSLSRRRALSILGLVLDEKKKFIPSGEKGLSGIVLVQALESELERRFVQSLEVLSGRGRIQIKPRSFEFKNGYRLKVGDQEWDLEPQVELGANEGLSRATRPDFQLTHSVRRDVPPIYLYLDGWEYHYNRLGIDTRQRMELHKQGRFFWTLTWDDVRDVLNPTPRHGGLLGFGDSSRFLTALQRWNEGSLQDVPSLDKLSMLLRFLERPDAMAWRKLATSVAASNAVDIQPDDGQEWQKRMQNLLPSSHGGWGAFWKGIECGKVGGKAEWSARLSGDPLKQSVMVWRLRDQTGFGDDDRSTWEDAWRAANLFQFLPEAWFVSEAAAEQGLYDGINWRPKAETVEFANTAFSALAELLATDENHSLLVKLLLRFQVEHLDAPLGYYEIFEEDMVCGQAQFAWPEKRVGIVLDVVEAQSLEKLGWIAFDLKILETPEGWARLLEVVR